MKKGLIEFNRLSDLSLAKVLERIENNNKLLYGDMTINDLSFAGDVGKLKIWEFDKKDVFGWGGLRNF